jgi:hypothetical protein
MHGRILLTGLLALVASALPASAASAGDLYTSCRTVNADAAGPCRLAEGAASNASAVCRREVPVPDEELCATPLNPPVSEGRIAAFERSWTHRTLLFQQGLGDTLGFRDAPWVGTHNSSNTAAEPFTVSGADHNQQLSLGDQLRLGVRSLELDLHWTQRNAVVVCHGRGEEELHAGCTTERTLDARLPEIAGWLAREENRDEVLMLYLEDHLGAQEGHDAAAAILGSALGSRIYRTDGGCDTLPLTGLTRQDIRDAGKQVLLVAKGCSGGGAWRSLVFDFGPVEVESRPQGYKADCTSDFTAAQRRDKMVRYFEDSTVLAAMAGPTGISSADDGLTPETTAAMVRCGVELFGFDQLLPDDGRLDAMVWSWAEGEPSKTGDCAARTASDRWDGRSCVAKLRFACRNPRGGWVIVGPAGKRKSGDEACADAGATFDAPRTGAENAALGAVAGAETVWVGLPKTGKKSRGSRR